MSEAGFTKGPWRACHNGKCSCGQIWSAEYPVATVTVGEWGDEYPSLRIVGTSIDAKAEAYMDGMVYGEVSPALAEANARLIAAAPDLLEATQRVETVLAQVVTDIEATRQLLEWHESTTEMLVVLRAAIAKALGR